MTIGVNSIGNNGGSPLTWTFLSLHAGERGGAPTVPMQQLALIQRAGVDGTAFIFLGAKGKPFKVPTLATYATRSDAITALGGYRALCSAPAQPMFWGGTDLYTLYNLLYKVLDVEGKIKHCSCATGGVPVSNGLWLIEAEWTLIPIYGP